MSFSVRHAVADDGNGAQDAQCQRDPFQLLFKTRKAHQHMRSVPFFRPCPTAPIVMLSGQQPLGLSRVDEGIFVVFAGRLSLLTCRVTGAFRAGNVSHALSCTWSCVVMDIASIITFNIVLLAAILSPGPAFL